MAVIGWLSIFLTVLICGCGAPPIVIGEPPVSIEGTWVQTFQYDPGPRSAGRVYPEEVGWEPPPEYKSARITFDDSLFSWECTPPERYLDGRVLGEPITGQFVATGNELLLLGYRAPKWDRFFYAIENDTLRISVPAEPTVDGFATISSNSWLWANSMGRREGEFLRVRE